MLELWKVRTLLERRTPTKVVRKENTNPRMQRMLTILTRRNQQLLNQRLKFDMSFLDVDALQQQGSERIKIGLDTGAGKTAWPQSITYGRTIPGDSDLTFRTATGELVKSGKRLYVAGCDDWGSNLRVRGVQAPVCKPLLSFGEYTTTGGVIVLYGDKGYMFHRRSNVAKKIDAWIQKDVRDSQYHVCTVAFKENNVYNIYMKPRGNKTDAMPLSD